MRAGAPEGGETPGGQPFTGGAPENDEILDQKGRTPGRSGDRAPRGGPARRRLALPDSCARVVGERRPQPVAAGRLHRLHRGVFAVGRRGVTLRGLWMAAVLACGPGAVLSHRSALELHGAAKPSRRLPAVTSRSHHKTPCIEVHTSTTLTRQDITLIDAVPCTSVARTLLDFAERAPPRELARAVEEVERIGLFDGTAMDRVLSRANGRRGTGRSERHSPSGPSRRSRDRRPSGERCRR